MSSIHRIRFSHILMMLGIIALGLAGRSTLAAPGAQRSTTIEMQDFQFAPKTVTIVVGTTVNWPNPGGATYEHLRYGPLGQRPESTWRVLLIHLQPGRHLSLLLYAARCSRRHRHGRDDHRDCSAGAACPDRNTGTRSACSDASTCPCRANCDHGSRRSGTGCANCDKRTSSRWLGRGTTHASGGRTRQHASAPAQPRTPRVGQWACIES